LGRTDWTDFNVSDPGITLLELFAFLAEQLQSSIERSAAEERRRSFRRRALVLGAISCALVLARWKTGEDG
jgi:hypothetical protein